MEIIKKIIDNRYTYAQYIALPATILSCLGFFNVINEAESGIWAIMLVLGILLSLCSYCLGGLLTAIKSALSIAKWGWIVVPFPYDLATFPIAFIISMLVLFLAPIIPIRKAYKDNNM